MISFYMAYGWKYLFTSILWKHLSMHPPLPKIIIIFFFYICFPLFLHNYSTFLRNITPNFFPLFYRVWISLPPVLQFALLPFASLVWAVKVLFFNILNFFINKPFGHYTSSYTIYNDGTPFSTDTLLCAGSVNHKSHHAPRYVLFRLPSW